MNVNMFFIRKPEEKMPQSHLVDLLDVNLGGDPTPVDPWGMPQPPRPQVRIEIICLGKILKIRILT